MCVFISLHPFSHLLKKQRGPVSCFLLTGQPTILSSGDRIRNMMLFYASWEAHIPSCKFLLAPVGFGPGSRPGPCCPVAFPQVRVGTVPPSPVRASCPLSLVPGPWAPRETEGLCLLSVLGILAAACVRKRLLLERFAILATVPSYLYRSSSQEFV